MRIFKLSSEEKYKIWAKWEVFNKHRGLLIDFIDDGILENNPKLFRGFFREYVQKANDFYTTLAFFTDKEMENFDFNVDFKTGIAKIEPSMEVYNKENFALTSLRLKDDFLEKVKECLK